MFNVFMMKNKIVEIVEIKEINWVFSTSNKFKFV